MLLPIRLILEHHKDVRLLKWYGKPALAIDKVFTTAEVGRLQNRKAPMKKFLTTILVTAVLFVAILAPFEFGTKTARAADGSVIATAECNAATPSIWARVLLSPIYGWCLISKTVINSPVSAFIFDAVVGKVLYGAGYLAFHISSVFLILGGFILDQSISASMNVGIGQIEAVSKGWAVARDLTNMFFIFILLYVAIATILQVEGFNTKKLLTNIIIVALLVNFSLVITKVVIDTSNIIALQFYNSMTVNGTKNISEIFMKGLKLQTIIDVNKGPLNKQDTFSNTNTATVFFGGTALILVAAFVFFAIGIMFVTRSVVLMFLMILGPLAFLASVLPGTSSHAQKWWKTLLDQSFFAPASLSMLWVVAALIGEIRLLETSSDISAQTFSEAFNANPAHFSIIFNFIILITMMVAALVIAKSMGAYGADTMMKWGDSARKFGQGFVGRHTIGRAAGVIAESDIARKMLGNKVGSALGGRYVQQALSGVASASFGGAKGGYTGAIKETAARQAKFAEYVGKGKGGEERQAAYVKSLEGGAFAKGLRTVTGIGAAGPQAVKMIEKNTAKQSAKKNKEAELAKLEEEHKKLEGIPKEKDETRLQELKVARTLTTHPGGMANINDEIAEINKRKERRIEVLNRINDLRDKLEMSEKLDKLSDEVGKGGVADSGAKGKATK